MGSFTAGEHANAPAGGPGGREQTRAVIMSCGAAAAVGGCDATSEPAGRPGDGKISAFVQCNAIVCQCVATGETNQAKDGWTEPANQETATANWLAFGRPVGDPWDGQGRVVRTFRWPFNVQPVRLIVFGL